MNRYTAQHYTEARFLDTAEVKTSDFFFFFWGGGGGGCSDN